MPEYGAEYRITIQGATPEQAELKLGQRLHGYAHVRRCSPELPTEVLSWTEWYRDSDGVMTPTYGATSPLVEMSPDRFDEGGGI